MMYVFSLSGTSRFGPNRPKSRPSAPRRRTAARGLSLQAAKELHQVGIITPFQLGVGGSDSRIASGQRFGLHCEVGFSVDIGGVHRDVTKPCANRIDINTRAKQMGRRCVSNGMRADLLLLQRGNLTGRRLEKPRLAELC